MFAITFVVACTECYQAVMNALFSQATIGIGHNKVVFTARRARKRGISSVCPYVALVDWIVITVVGILLK